MSLELVNTFATLGTFLVIAATAIAAIVQLRHMRGSNQIAGLNELRETMERPEFLDARHFVETELATRLGDPAFRHELVHRFARTDENRPLIAKILLVGNFLEGAGLFLKTGLVEKHLAMDGFLIPVTDIWEALAPATAIFRREQGKSLWENFEYLAVQSQDWLAAHPEGTYPPEVRRIELKDEFLAADRQYAASLVSA